MNVVMTGASGMIGSLVLAHCLEDARVSKVTSLLRNTTGLKHDKLTEIIVDDFLVLDDMAGRFKDLDAVYYCQGVYTGAVDRETFRQVTVDYPDALANAVLANSPQARFCLLSGAGADRTEKSRMAFARDKGIIENRLSAKGLGSFHSFRPGYIYPVTPRQEPGFGYRLSRWLYPVIRLFGDNASIRSTDLAQAMFQVGMTGHELEVLENRDIARLVRNQLQAAQSQM